MAKTNKGGKATQTSPADASTSSKKRQSQKNNAPSQDNTPTSGKKQAAKTPPKGKPSSAPQSPKNVLPDQENIPKPKRVNRGYRLREDLVKRCKRIALDEERWLYEVLDEAIEFYLHMREAPKGFKQPK